MKHAVVFAHPKPDSFTATMARAYADAAAKAGHVVAVRDLYVEDFDPRLGAEEIPGPGKPQPRPDVVAERKRIADADVFAFFYPLWFNAPPAMLKGYVDRVFGMGFGYAPGAGGTEPLLEGKKLISFSSSGAPTDWVRDTGAWRAIRKLFDEHFAEVCGLEVVDHVHFGEITLGISEEAVADCRKQVEATLRERFGRLDADQGRAPAIG